MFADHEQTVTFQNYLNHVYDGAPMNMKDIRYLVSHVGQHHEKVARFIEEEVLVRLDQVQTDVYESWKKLRTESAEELEKAEDSAKAMLKAATEDATLRCKVEEA